MKSCRSLITYGTNKKLTITYNILIKIYFQI